MIKEHMANVVNMHVLLLDEGVATAKRVQAKDLGNGTYQILLPEDYDPEDEEWEFVPGDIVRCERVEKGWAEPLFLAIEKVA